MFRIIEKNANENGKKNRNNHFEELENRFIKNINAGEKKKKRI